MDESGHRATPWLGGTVQTDGKGIQNTRLGSINDLGRDIFIFQIESKARQAPGWVHLPHPFLRPLVKASSPTESSNGAKRELSNHARRFFLCRNTAKNSCKEVMEHGRRIGLLLHP
jgi:hypothetical protein